MTARHGSHCRHGGRGGGRIPKGLLLRLLLLRLLSKGILLLLRLPVAILLLILWRILPLLHIPRLLLLLLLLLRLLPK